MTHRPDRLAFFAGVDSLGPRIRVAPLASLTRLGVGRDEPDIRGWPVVTNDGQRVGRVRDLLVELATREVRYLDVAFDLALAGGRPDLHVAIPIGCARAGTRRNLVNVRCVSRDQILHAPRHGAGLFTIDDEHASRRFFGSADAGVVPAADGGNFYAGPDFESHAFWSVRRKGREQVPYLLLLDAEAAPASTSHAAQAETRI
jgi:hypothetical protein